VAIPRRRFIAGTVAGLGTVLLGPAGAGPLGSRLLAEPAPGPRLLLIGDSLTGGPERRRLMRAAISDAGTWSGVVVNGRNGRKILEAVPLVTAHRELAASAGVDAMYVVALGTNDLSQTWLNTASDRAKLTARVESVIAAADGRLVVWMNTSFSRRNPGYPGRARRFNALLTEIAARTPNMRVIDWYAVQPPASSQFTPDGIHLSGRTYLRRARLTARMADQYSREFHAPEPT